MKQKYSPEQIVKFLREAEGKLVSCKTVEEVCREMGVSDATIVHAARRAVELADPATTWDAIVVQWADEPPADSAEMAGRGHKPDVVVALGLLAMDRRVWVCWKQA